MTSTVPGWIAKGHLNRLDRDRNELNARMGRDNVARIEQSAKRNEEKVREINVQLEKMDRKIDEHYRETGGALLDLTYQSGQARGSRGRQGRFGESVGAALLAPERRTVVGP